MPPGKKPPGKKPPRKLPPRKLPPGNMPHRKIALRNIAPRKLVLLHFLLLLTLSFSCLFSNFIVTGFRGVSRTPAVSIIDLLVSVVNGSN